MTALIGNKERAWQVIEARMAEIRHRQAWLEKAREDIGPNVLSPAPGYASALQRLEVAKAMARGAAQVMAIFLGVHPDDVAREAAQRFGER